MKYFQKKQSSKEEIKVEDAGHKVVDGIGDLVDENDSLEKSNRKNKSKIRTRNMTIVVLIIIIIILLLRSCGSKSLGQQTIAPDLQTGEYVEKDIQSGVQQGKNVTLPGFDDREVSEDYPYITIYNFDENKDVCYLKYIFTVAGEDTPIYESKLVEGGYKYSVDFYSLLSQGTYNISALVVPYTVDTLQSCSDMTFDFTLTVK